MPQEFIEIRGAGEHNLRNIDLKIPKDRLIVFTGVSGSGKSSLAFDTIYAEGQRRYIESLSAYARQFIGQIEKPKFESIIGLSPSISIDQKSTSRNPRSTVATVTEIYDYLRVLFSRAGTIYCLECGQQLGAQTQDEIVDQICSLDDGTRILILAPIVRGRRGEYRQELEDARGSGFARVRIDGEIFDLMDEIKLNRRKRHDVDIVVDRIVIKSDSRSRVAEAVEIALKMGDGWFLTLQPENDLEQNFSKNYTCTACQISYEPLAPRDFSFNSPAGMCETCDGLGTSYGISPELVVPDPSKSIKEGAIVFLGKLERRHNRFLAISLADHYGFSLDEPWENLSDEIKKAILFGNDFEEIPIIYRQYDRKRYKRRETYAGLIHTVEMHFAMYGDLVGVAPPGTSIEDFLAEITCPTCDGKRLRSEILSVKIGDKSILDINEMTIDHCLEFFGSLKLSSRQAIIAEELLKEIRGRLKFLINVGLGYLSLDRGAPTLSGGEAQRIRLASQIGAGLRDVIYVLDEPSIGLHPRDNDHLLRTLKILRDQGNTVIVVEHDEDTIRSADHIVDFGPRAGVQGGEIAAIGPPKDVIKNADSLTAQYLRGDLKIDIPTNRRTAKNENWIEVVGAKHNNLKNIDLRFPIGCFTVVTGVSGSGKSSLINDILHAKLAKDLMRAETNPGKHDLIQIVNGENGEPIEFFRNEIDKVIGIDQSPIGRIPRSNPATYTKLFDEIRKLFADLPESKIRGYKPGRFSFNVTGGRCEACHGNGYNKIELQLIADVWVKCNVCDGKRYNKETLTIEYKGKNIADVLAMDVQEALDHFANIAKVTKYLDTLHRVGLDYMKLGQPSPTLSGGEAQRVKLARELSKRSTGKTLYILDEPTTGLHFDDVKKLLEVLHEFVDRGNTVIVIEHNLEVIKTADHVIDLGPEGGEEGGYVVGFGTPEQITEIERSHTATALRRLFDRKTDHVLTDLKTIETETETPRIVSDIIVRGACEHNLKKINVEIPHRKMTTLTGVSGSGKSSLALDTIYAEGQRRYVESLSTYARQFLGQLEKPKADKIEGLSPAIAIERQASSKNPRSTVGTVTEIYDYLRVLFARVGQAHCTRCGEPIATQTVQEIVEKISVQTAEKRVYVMFPIDRPEDRDYKKLFRELQQKGFARIEIDGEIFTFDQTPALPKRHGRGYRRHDLKVVVDRLAISKKMSEDDLSRLTEAVETAISESVGFVDVRIVDGDLIRFTTNFFCIPCQKDFEDLTPRHFSFNSYYGWCNKCEGIGSIYNEICPSCDGTRLKDLPRHTTFYDKTISEITAMSIREAKQFFRSIELDEYRSAIASELLSEINKRLHFLNEIGLHYVALDRLSRTVSGGEMQRIRLASQLGSGLTGVTYILDEPTIGLHQRDNERLINAIQNLRDLGNTILVVEHDAGVIEATDHVIDFGPGAGKLGGEITAIGTPNEICQNVNSLTGKYLSGVEQISQIRDRRNGNGESIKIFNATENNLKQIDVSIPIGTLTCITGVSGSGKSSLIEGALLRSNDKINVGRIEAGNRVVTENRRDLETCQIEFPGQIKQILHIDQSPIGESPRSNPATYTGVFTKIRSLFASLTGAKMRGFISGFFSFNIDGGRCYECQGLGQNRIEMHFLADVWLKCDECDGTGYKREILEIRYKNKNIADVLAMTVDEAIDHFREQTAIVRSLKMLSDVGLGYIQLGQAGNTLSSGEAQRIKLATELSRRTKGETLYVMDEPTTGLHFDDVKKLLKVIDRLVKKGNTVVVIEHNLELIKCADWVIDLGPGGGDEGGELIAMGTPEQIAEIEQSHTGFYLRDLLEK